MNRSTQAAQKHRRRRLLCEDLEKRYLLAGDLTLQVLTNQLEVASESDAIGIASGDNVRWTYKVTNNGTESFGRGQVFLKDDNGTPTLLGDDFNTFNGAIYLEESSDAGNDNLLSPGETWEFTAWGTALDLNQTVVEAEHMSRSGFEVRNGINASGGSLVALTGISSSGSLATSFTGASGTYDLKVFVQDEFDGHSSIDVRVGGASVGTINLNRNSDGGGSDNGNFSEFVLSNLAINSGDQIQLNAFGNGTEFVRTDRLVFDRVDGNAVYANTAMLIAGSNTATDTSYYTKPQPGIDLEKFTNGQDADTPATAVKLLPGASLTWLYRVENTGNVPFPIQDVFVKDDNGTPADSSDDFNTTNEISLFPTPETEDGILAPGEQIVFFKDSVAQNLTVVSTIAAEAEDAQEFGFGTHSSSGASGGQIIKLNSFGGDGEVWNSFGGQSGIYQIKLFVQDESDGESDIDVLVDGTEVGSFRLDRNTDGIGNDNGPFSEFVLDDVVINQFDEIRLEADGDDSELIRLDRVEFVGSEFRSMDGPNLIINGSFEDTSGMTSTGYGFSSNGGSVVGWTATGGNIEFHNDERDGIQATDGSNWLDLDESPGNVTVTQDVEGITSGETYELSFKVNDGANTLDGTILDNTVAVYWGGELIADINPVDGTWTTYTFDVVGGAGDGSNQLTFQGGGAEDKLGVSIDEVSLNAVEYAEEVGFYKNIGEVWIGPNLTDADPSHYTNPDPNRPAKLGNFVFFDANRNGIRDAGELGVPDITVTLTGGGADGLVGTSDDTTEVQQTNAQGIYLFRDLPPSREYKVTFSELPAGFVFSPANQGTDDELDSDADPATGMSPIVFLAEDEDNRTIDAGVFQILPGSIGDLVFFDTDEDGLQDEEEPGVPGVTVTLTGGGADGVIGTGDDDTTVSQETGLNGSYEFTGLNPGEEYKVTFSDLPAGYAFTLANQGTNDAADSDADPTTGMTDIIVLANGEQNDTVDAGVFIPSPEGSIGDFVFFDLNENGIQDEGETGVPNVIVTLTGGGADGVIGTGGDDTTESKLTSAEGFYSFNLLNPGEEYKVSFELELGLGLTQAKAGTNRLIDSDPDPITGMTDIVVLGFGEDNLSIDAGVIAVPIPPAALGNQVFVDENQNGQRDAGEPGLSKVTVTLSGGGTDGVIGTADDTTATTETDRQGKYNFLDLNPLEEYQVTFELPSGYEFTVPDAVGDKIDSDADPVTGETPIVVLQPDEFDKSIDAGYVPLTARLGNRVFQDSNGNGRQDAGEIGVAGALVLLRGGGADKVLGTSDDTAVTKATNSSGLYEFSGLDAGVEYQVTFALPAGYVFTSQDAAGDKVDSDADPVTGESPVVVLGPGSINRSVDAGLIPLLGSIGDEVFFDENRNGIQDRGEDGVPNVTVTLTAGGADLVLGTSDDVTEVQFTDGDGLYTFNDLDTEAEHRVVFSNLPVGFEFTIQDATIDNRDSDPDPLTGATEIIDLRPGQAKVNVDAGLVETFIPGVINSYVFLDNNGNGIQETGDSPVPNVTVTLIGGGFDGVVGTPDDSSEQQLTDGSGAYSFTGLIPDREYQVVFSDLPSGFVFTKQDVGTDDLDSDANPTTGAAATFILPDGGTQDIDAGIVTSVPGLIGNRVFDDVNRNGIQDSGEGGIPNLTVVLFGGGPDRIIGTSDDTSVIRATNANGAYTFSGLNPGEEYQVFIPNLPAGIEFTLADQGTLESRDSDFDPTTQRSPIVVLCSGEENRDIDAGLVNSTVIDPGLIGNKVWEDLNGDGFQDSTEPGVVGVLVTLTGGGPDGVIDGIDDTTATDVTNANGIYQFADLNPGERYQLTFSNLPAGYVLTIKDAVDVPESRDSDADPITGMTDIIVLSPGEENRDIDAGVLPSASVDLLFAQGSV